MPSFVAAAAAAAAAVALLLGSDLEMLYKFAMHELMHSLEFECIPCVLLNLRLSYLMHSPTGDRNMFTVNMYCSRMNARGIRIGLVVDCTALDLEEFDPLPDTSSTTPTTTPKGKFAAKKKKNPLDRRVRYFHNPSEWDDFDVEYCRLVPPKNEQNGTNENDGEDEEKKEEELLASQVLPQFFSIISKFIQKSRSSMEGNSTVHIALFDSRGGLGVASYLAAAYMCHSMKAPVYAALDAVKEGSPAQPSSADSDRKWGLCDVRLIKDLQNRYEGKKEIVFDGDVPSWWFAIEDEEEDVEEDEDEGDKKPSAQPSDEEKELPKRKRDARIVIPPCESADEDSKRQRTSNHIMPPPSAKPRLFPILPKEVLEPVAFDSPKSTRAMTVLAQLTQQSLPMVKLPFKSEVDISDCTSLESDTNYIIMSIKSNVEEYKVTWLSTKGRRGLLLILSEAVYFIEQYSDTENDSGPSPISVSVVTNIKFPSPKDASKQQHRSLLDVVLVHDVEKNAECFRFYILDILCIEGGMVFHKPWKERWRFLNDGVLMPRKKDEARQQQQPSNGGHVYAKEMIRIRAKEYFPLQKLEFVIKEVCAGVAHQAHGVRIIPMGAYGIGKEDEKTMSAAIWRRGGSTCEQKFLSHLK
jgi:hypothetical protein